MPPKVETEPAMATATSSHSSRLAADLRVHLTRLIEHLAGSPARPVRLIRQTGLDKSLASRLIQATKTGSDLDFLHLVPSPTGLRILLDASQPLVDPELHRALELAIDQFQLLLDTLPGGRQTLDAQLGHASADIRLRREHMARQASFKAVSFLFGHYSETLTTAIFVVPDADGVHTQMIEVHRRIGLHRVTPGTPMPLLSLFTFGKTDGPAPGAQMASIQGDVATQRAEDFIVSAGSSMPLPELVVEREGQFTTFVLPGDAGSPPPVQLTTAFRVLRAQRLAADGAVTLLRNYMLNTPCHRLVRDIYVADTLWPGMQPLVRFYLPGPSGAPVPAPDPERRHFRQLNLSASFEPLPMGQDGMALEGVPDQAAALQHVLRQAGLQDQAFRGWRCELSYPVPLVEMQFSIRNATPPD
ncbi:MAG: hypothetical protein KAZ63_01855 [Vitreoscilla sp.]|nr:hypothetical protein [Vitreoscilla sp.]